MTELKCVLVGDATVGKTCALISYTENKFPTSFTLTIFDTHSVTVKAKGETYRLALWDTAGVEEYDKLRPVSYPGTHVFLVCFSIVSPTSFQNAKDKWVPEIKRHSETVPFLLVGTKADLRDDLETVQKLGKQNESPITVEQGQELANELKATKYVECSALTQIGLPGIFIEAILAATGQTSSRESCKKCVIS